VLRDLSGEKLLRQELYAVFEAASIYLQFRRPLADALLAEDGPAWRSQALGWLCYSQRRLPHVQRGAVVYISLRDRLPCDSAYLPPPELLFEAALAWALRAGEPEPPEPDDADDADDANDTDQTFRVSETLKVSGSPEDQLWRAVLDRLSRELPRGVLDSQLRPARLVSLDPQRCVILAPSPQSRDWLATRLVGVLERALREVTGQEMTVEIRCVSVPQDGASR
jgi:hypothetical protein